MSAISDETATGGHPMNDTSAEPWRIAIGQHRFTRLWYVEVSYLSPHAHGGQVAQSVARLRWLSSAASAIDAGRGLAGLEEPGAGGHPEGEA